MSKRIGGLPESAKWNWLFLSSLVVGVAVCSSPYILRGPWADAHGKFIFFGWPTAWMSIVIVTLIRHGARGLWLLLGAPFALFWFWFPL